MGDAPSLPQRRTNLLQDGQSIQFDFDFYYELTNSIRLFFLIRTAVRFHGRVCALFFHERSQPCSVVSIDLDGRLLGSCGRRVKPAQHDSSGRPNNATSLLDPHRPTWRLSLAPGNINSSKWLMGVSDFSCRPLFYTATGVKPILIYRPLDSILSVLLPNRSSK